MLREKVCLQRLFECAVCTALISEIVWKHDEHRTLSLTPQRVAQKRKVSKI